MEPMTWIFAGIALLMAAVSLLLFYRCQRARKRIRLLEHTAALIESAPYYIAYDDNGKSDLYANAEAYRMVGKVPGKPLAKETTHDEAGMRLLVEKAFPAVKKYGTWVGENQLLHSDGHLVDVQQFIFPVKDKQGNQLGMGTLMRDITAEKALRRNYDIQLALLESSSNFIVALDQNFRVVYANSGVYSMSGYSREEIGIGFTPSTFHTPETCRRIDNAWQTALREGICEIESEFVCKDGSSLTVTHKTFAIKDQNGAIMGVGSILNDISELKEVQEELVRARDAAEAANKAKSFFLSNMSHEIRTPMNAIIGMTRIARASEDLGRIRESLSKVETSSEHLLNVINDVLDLSKIESGKLELYNTEFDLGKAIGDTVGIIGVKAEEKKLRLQVSIEPDIPHCLFGDANRLSQVVMNLLSNAVKFTPEGGHITLDIRGRRLRGEDVELDCQVSDTGIGMTAEQVSRLFRAFEQTDAGITARFGGTGLGLVISKRLVEMMGGEISAQSVPGQGSCFRFSVVYQLAEGQEEGKAQEKAFSAEAMDFDGKTILLVEDMEINREILKALLEPTHVKIDEAEDGQIAVERFREHPERYSLIFMDLQMPNLDGYGATRAIRESGLATAQTVPIIAMTANAFQEDVVRCLEAGMNDHISKPINMEEVLKKMGEQMGKAKGVKTHGQV